MSAPDDAPAPDETTPRASDGDPARDDDAHDDAGDGGPFNLGTLRRLVELMEKHGLSEVNLKTEGAHWKLRRGPEVVTAFPPVASGYAPPPMPAAPAPQAAAAAPAPAAAPSAQGGVFIKSPTVGTFYSASSPDDPPFVAAGSRVQPDTVVCLIEAMKVFNQIPAEVSGVIAEVLAKNGDSIEFGQPLFRVTPG
jgi:acetyl-CoA carboxylase biotin carboxyl carrier protein